MRGVLAQEIHHRVKNNLQTVASLLRLQARAAEPSIRAKALEHSVNRILAIAAVHEVLTERREEDVDLADLFDRLRAMLVQGVGGGKEVSATLASVHAVRRLARRRSRSCSRSCSQNALEHGGDRIRVELARRNGDSSWRSRTTAPGSRRAAAGTGSRSCGRSSATSCAGRSSSARRRRARRGRLPRVTVLAPPRFVTVARGTSAGYGSIRKVRIPR